jgi:hypothetical protein
MPTVQVKKNAKSVVPVEDAAEPAVTTAVPTVVGWQGIKCQLPPDWSVTGLSMDRDNGYLRIDAPGEATLTVQIRWMNAAAPKQKNGYTLLAPIFRRLLKRPDPEVPAPELRPNLEKLLKDTAKQARKGKSEFDSTIKPERTEGEHDERQAMNFSYSGEGRGQGKIWYCKTCKRLVIAQAVGMAKDGVALGNVASQLLGSLRCHADDGFDTWALYGLEVGVPADFRLEEQKLTSGHLHLAWSRGGERVVVDRWALANMTLKKFTLGEWFQLNALQKFGKFEKDDGAGILPYETIRYQGRITGMNMIRALREAKIRLRRLATRYEGGIWHQPDANRIVMVQVLQSKKTQNLWQEIVSRCACH